MEDKDKEEEEEDESCWLWADELNEDNGKFEVFESRGKERRRVRWEREFGSGE